MSLHLQSPPVANVPFSRPATPSLRSTHVAFVGLGSIGYSMAKNLAINRPAHPTGNPPLLVWNRSIAKSEALVKEAGANRVTIAANLQQVVYESDVIITCLANDDVVKTIYEEFAKLLPSAPSKKRIFVESSTIFPTLAGELDTLVSAAPHAHFLTCPVFGAHAVAAKGQLLILMSGDYHSKKEVAYLLVPAVGRKVIDLGENIEKAPTLKLLGNSLILGAIEVLAEAQTLGEKSGIGGKTLHEVVRELFPAPAFVAYSEKMINDDFDGTKGFALEGGIKDASHIRRLTALHNSPMPVIDIAHQHLITTRAIHTSMHQEGQALTDVLDWSGIVAASRVSAGLDAFDRKKHHNNVVPEADD